MHITWLGGSSIKLQTKPDSQDLTILIDPYKPSEGIFPHNLMAHVVLYTHGKKNSITITGNPFILATPGEIETHGVLIAGTYGDSNEQTVFRIDVEQMSVGHLGFSSKILTDKEEALLSGVDILFVPVGGDGCYNAEQAAKTVSTIEPRVVIPIAFKNDTNPKAMDVTFFLKEMGVSNNTPEKKAILKKKDLPVEDLRIIVLDKE